MDASMKYSDTEGRAKIATLRFEKNSEILAKYRKTEINMKDFDLRAAKRGAAVCTKAGKLVRIISFDSDHSFCGVPQPIAAELEADNGDGTLYFCENGRYYPGSVNSSYDLRMRDDDYAEKLARKRVRKHTN